MKTPLDIEIRQILKDLEIPILGPDHALLKKLHELCAPFRSHLLTLECLQNQLPISPNTFWDVTPKVRFDILSQDIPAVANQLAFAIGFSKLYLSQISNSTTTYFPTCADYFFWYHLDFSFRLASSGWDRLALLLDIVFNLNIGTKCNISRVLEKIPEINNQMIRDSNFKALKKFRDTNLSDLEGKRGEGLRHEATHLFLPTTVKG